ncbi:hypothetical protein [Paenibacillus medicaginis]|uniref:Uncharacterized protein n=1 Tax=Paenibacillus medicaginis TaxID=1470560 RepID=A0ABV5BUZ8_9BACL
MVKNNKIARYRSFPYTVNYTAGGGIKVFQWAGSKRNKVDIKEVPEEVVEWLMMNSRCFSEGELVIIEDTEEVKDIVDNIDDLEKYKNNSHSREDIEKILTGNFNAMKKELEKITVNEEKRFVIDVAKDVKLDSSSKQKFIAEWANVPVDAIFGE